MQIKKIFYHAFDYLIGNMVKHPDAGGYAALIISAIVLAGSLPGRQVSGQVLRGQTSNDTDSVETIYTLQDSGGPVLEVIFREGRAHNHPLMAVWIEDTAGQYIRTLYVAESIGRGVFRHGDPSGGKWKPGPVRRPAALPYWGHQRGIRAEDGYYLPTADDPVPDAITGPTPKGSFVLHSRAGPELPQKFNLLLELNQSWDWNEYWTNDKFPGDEHYMSSSQPALVYKASIKPDDGISEYELMPVGHSHWSGQNGNLYEDLGTITTALNIAEMVTVRFPD